MNGNDPRSPLPEFAFSGYHRLMHHSVVDILLVASPYDCFILEEDGQFSDRIFAEYLELHLAGSPRFRQVTTASEALALLKSRRGERIDMVLMTPNCVDMTPRKLAQTIKRRHPQMPVLMLSYDRVTATGYANQPEPPFDEVFLWTGDPRLLMAMVKSVEDRLNVQHDTRIGDVRVIIVVEDSPAFYSAYLPIIYTEVLRQTRTLMSDVLNEAERLYRMRARPKILLVRTYEGALKLLRAYRSNLLGLVVDMRFWRRDVLDPDAGAALIKLARRHLADLPILLQSAEPSHAEVAEQHEVSFADKNSPELLGQLRNFMRSHLGFGPFIFRLPTGEEVDRANDLDEMVEVLRRVPGESIAYHGARNHFSNWLMARSQFPLAHELRPQPMSGFETDEDARAYLIAVFSAFISDRQRGQISFFNRGTDPLSRDFLRIGGGSLGGKARGLAFASAQLARHDIHERFPDIRIAVPRLAVICADVFEHYVNTNRLKERALAAGSDEEVAELFLSEPLGHELMADLAALLADVRYPVAVRSSSLLEDSAYQPFAGLYRTILLPNIAESLPARVECLSRAVRLVMASTYYRAPLTFMDATGIRHEEQAMAVVVQQLVGRRHGDRFYPDFAGVAQSFNFYPIRYLEPEDGIATVALGLGQRVVEGRKALRFCPRHPAVLPQMSTVDDTLRYSQHHFYALDLSPQEGDRRPLLDLDLAVAERDGTLDAIGATYVADDDRIVDTVHARGARVVNFAGVLKHGRYPLAPLLDELLRFGREGLGSPVEIEFACNLGTADSPPEIALLQIRPLVAGGELADVDVGERPGEVPLVAGPALGNGVVSGLRDIVMVAPSDFDKRKTREYARAVGRLNSRLLAAHRPYLLMGLGRWGTADPWLGIPVEWQQVSGARVIVELASRELRVDPSQGTHFFHNITSLRVGYFTVDIEREDQRVDLEWLSGLESTDRDGDFVHIELPEAVEVRIDGRVGRGIVVRAE